MKDTYQKVFAASAILLVIAVVVIGNMILQRLDRIAHLAEQREPTPVRTPQQVGLLPKDERFERRKIPQEHEWAPAGRFARQQDVATASQLADSNSPPSREEGSPFPVITAPSAERRDQIRLLPVFPKPMFVGMPRTFGSLILQDPWGGVAEGILVPRGTRLLSARKPVTSSDEAPVIGELPLVTDGDKEGADGSYVELGAGPQWVQIDLEAERRIYAIAVWHYHAQARVYHDVAILLSTNADFSASTVAFNNDTNDTLGVGEGQDKEYVETHRGLLQGTDGVRARYIRLYSNGNTSNEMNHYIEIEAYGLP